MIFFYGGSWDSGSKGDYLFVGQALAARGITMIIPDYRLYPEVRFPAFVEDGAQATRWAGDRVGTDEALRHGPFRRRAYRADAGGQHALSRRRRRRSHEAARASIGLSGPYDFLPLTSAKLIDIFGGANDPTIEAITFAKAPLPPALLHPWHGRHDRLSAQQRAIWRRPGAGPARRSS